MSEFSDRPFVAGSLVGLRAFDVDALGRLTGVTHKEVFKPGVNEATCAAGSMTFSGVPAGAYINMEYGSGYLGESHYSIQLPDGGTRYYTSKEAITADFPPPETDHHRPGQSDCTCGYYAYFDGTNHYAETGRVQALIEATGVITVGQRGFRAEKARLLALIDPTSSEGVPKLYPRRRKFFAIWNWLMVAANFVLGFVNIVQEDWWGATINLGVAAVIAGLELWSESVYRRLESERGGLLKMLTQAAGAAAPWDLVRRNYPDVPVYPSLREALAEFPLTTPPPPSPAEPDFWTRSA